MISDRLSQRDAQRGFLLDGYPRTAAQVDYLDEVLAARGLELDMVLQLDVADDVLFSRLLARAKESNRSDDNGMVIRHRIVLFHEQTAAVIARYVDRSILVRVDAEGSIDEVAERILQSLAAAKSPV
jgi:adenylate kinase